MNVDAQRLLISELSRARSLQGLDDFEERRPGLVARFGGILEAFRHLDVISNSELADWNQRVLSAVGMKSNSDPIPGIARAVSFPDHVATSREEVAPGNLLRQLSGPPKEIPWLGGKLRVLSLEIYEEELRIRWRAFPEPNVRLAFPGEMAALEDDLQGIDESAASGLRSRAEVSLKMMRLYKFHLEDDRGTTYHRLGSQAGGRGGERTGETRFAPTPPTEARELAFMAKDVSVLIAM